MTAPSSPAARWKTCTWPRPISVTVPGSHARRFAVDQVLAAAVAGPDQLVVVVAVRVAHALRRLAAEARVLDEHDLQRGARVGQAIDVDVTGHAESPSPREGLPYQARRFAAILDDMNPTTLPTLPSTLTLGAVQLTVADLDRSVAWYQRSLGLRVHASVVGTAALGDGTTTVIELVEDPLARPPRAATPGSTTTRCCIPRVRSSPAPRSACR